MYNLSHALEWAISVAHSSPSAEQSEPATGPVEHVLYCSKASRHFSEDELADLLEQTRAKNERCTITGLLCYSYNDGRFVQMLEGPGPEIERVYALIERDPRHHQLKILSRGAGPLHRFPDWRMALAKAPQDCYWLITCFEARLHQLLKPQVPIVESTLSHLLNRFGTMCTPAQPGGMLGAAHWSARPVLAAV